MKKYIFLITTKKYIPHPPSGVKFPYYICYSRDTNETFCNENKYVAIILRCIDKMTELLCTSLFI